ncbi:GMC oxidoreductase [Mycobacterium sp. 3519A]|uniref:GMC oxidoreductase n=1 Tax=Mycobacterium sp. 3519A TaxID=2057184 RepID=UPI001F3604B9|nr:GMC oxidoreductase [Mycobacterium sp. 3519A]
MVQVPIPVDGHPFPDNGYVIGAGLLAPKSRGTLKLSSSDPSDPPLADPNMLADPYDVEALVDAVLLCRELGGSEAFAAWRRSELAPNPDVQTRDELREYVRQTATTYFHPVGTCTMGRADDPSAVVAPDLRVRGVEGLRVADASIMPTVPHANTNAASIMVGERASCLILGT